uniref:Cell cycle checkpoint control protein RAD9A n=1 Tax=Timema shepardi TaxID=629360 RepID=A0A7R9G323_TIMSH|nr:unnamed protein product [Timema shepardi]
MWCIVSGNSVKVLARAMQCLTRMGKDYIYIEPGKETFCMRTINSSHSAYGLFTFSRYFFLEYCIETDNRPEFDSKLLHCRISVKAVQAIVRSLNLPKHVETCTISIKPESETIKVELKCRYNILKIQHVPVIAWESMELQIGQDSNPLNRFNASVKQFNDALVNFYPNPNDITITVNKRNLLMQNYISGTADPKKERRTEMLLQAGEFQDYHVEVDAQVTFNVKDWKSILAFAGSSSQPLMVKFEKAGRPVVFEASKDGILHAHFVLSTVMPLGSNPQLERKGIDGELTITKNMGAKYKKNMNIFEGLERKRAEFLRNKQNIGSSEKLAIQDSLAFLNSNESAVELLNEWLPNTGGIELHKQLSAKPTTSKTVHDEQDKDETFVQIVYSEENCSRTPRLNADPRQDRLWSNQEHYTVLKRAVKSCLSSSADSLVEVERLFRSKRYEEELKQMREAHKNNMGKDYLLRAAGAKHEERFLEHQEQL